MNFIDRCSRFLPFAPGCSCAMYASLVSKNRLAFTFFYDVIYALKLKSNRCGLSQHNRVINYISALLGLRSALASSKHELQSLIIATESHVNEVGNLVVFNLCMFTCNMFVSVVNLS